MRLVLIQLYNTEPNREVFNFHYLPKLYIGFNCQPFRTVIVIDTLVLGTYTLDIN